MKREQALLVAFVELADTLVDDYDVVDLLHRLLHHCKTVLDVAESGLMLSDQRGELHVLACTSERTRLLELFQLQNDEGPCLDCFRSGQPVLAPDLGAAAHRWPRFVRSATEEGFRSVHAVPMRLRAQTIGAMNLFGTRTGGLSAEDLLVAQALADSATIGILQERAVHRGEVLTEQLQTALTSRVIIEQAKGILAQASGDLDMHSAFTALRFYARATNTLLGQTAARLAAGTLDPGAVLAARPRAEQGP